MVGQIKRDTRNESAEDLNYEAQADLTNLDPYIAPLSSELLPPNEVIQASPFSLYATFSWYFGCAGSVFGCVQRVPYISTS